MNAADIESLLTTLEGGQVQTIEAGVWQVEMPACRLLAILSDDQSWLRMMVPIAAASEAEPFCRELLESNFDETGAVRYALHQEALWAVFQHALSSLAVEDCAAAIAQLLDLNQRGLKHCFDQYLDRQVSLIILAAKRQNISLEATLQNLDRFYQEGVMGDLTAPPEVRTATLDAWRARLERLWPVVDVSGTGTVQD
ncbi:MAG TPA: hypothetical protein V6D19_03820 [Stenomitos sp.]